MFIVTVRWDRVLQRRATVRREELAKRLVALLRRASPSGCRSIYISLLWRALLRGGHAIFGGLTIAKIDPDE
jgi:hypothetical protein